MVRLTFRTLNITKELQFSNYSYEAGSDKEKKISLAGEPKYLSEINRLTEFPVVFHLIDYLDPLDE